MGQWVKVQGEIINLKNTKGVTFFKIKDKTGEIQAIVFDDLKINSKKIQAIGKVEVYNGKLEIIIEELKVIE